MKIAIGADHAGYQLKDSLKRLLDEMGVPYEDFGTSNGHRWTIPTSPARSPKAWPAGEFDRGILVCGTGVGHGDRGQQGRRHSLGADRRHRHRQAVARAQRSEVLTLGARVLPESRAREIVKTFLQTPFDGGRHADARRKDPCDRELASTAGGRRGLTRHW